MDLMFQLQFYEFDKSYNVVKWRDSLKLLFDSLNKILDATLLDNGLAISEDYLVCKTYKFDLYEVFDGNPLHMRRQAGAT